MSDSRVRRSRSRPRVRCGKTDRDGRNVRDGVGRDVRLHERFAGPPVKVEVEGALRKDGPRRKEMSVTASAAAEGFKSDSRVLVYKVSVL